MMNSDSAYLTGRISGSSHLHKDDHTGNSCAHNIHLLVPHNCDIRVNIDR